MKIIDAKDLIIGRFATVAAKQALLGEEVIILNCEKAIITGGKANIIEKYKRKRSMGTQAVGPFFPRSPDRMIKRLIRGMLPYKQAKGDAAFKRVKCYNGIPEAFQGKELITIKEANVSKMPNLRYMTVGNVAKILGNKED
jgi:large subunit ribosomal protein L13